MTSEISSSFLSNTLKRRQQKRQEVTKVIQEGISSLNLEQQQQQINEGIYPLLNIDPESYLLDEGDERSMLEPNSYNNSDFKQTINILLNWINSTLNKDLIIIRSLEDDLNDGYILGKLIESYQPNIRLLYDDIPVSEELKKKTLKRVLEYVENCLTEEIKWTFERIYNRDLISILHLLLTLMKVFNTKTYNDLPKSLILKIIVVKKINGLLQTRIINECFIDNHQKEYGIHSRQGDLIDALFDLAPEKLINVEKTLLNFLNSQLNHYNIFLKEITNEHFQDGLHILYLICHLEKYFLIFNKYNHKKPISREQSHANFQLAFQLIHQAGIDIEQYCQIDDILSGNQRTLYRLIFQLYLRYNSDSNNLLQSITHLQPIRTDVDSPFL